VFNNGPKKGPPKIEDGMLKMWYANALNGHDLLVGGFNPFEKY